jgi:hypothetical protein
MKRAIQQCSFLHHAPFATKRARPVQQRLFISLAFTRRKRARPVMHQSSDQAELLKLSSGRDRERYVTGYIRRMCMQGKEAFNRVGDKSMHARRWMDGWMDAVVVRPPRGSGSGSVQGGSINRGMHYCASSEASSEIALGAGRRTKATSSMAGARTHAMPCLGAVPCRCSSTLCRQAGGARDSSCLIDGEIGEPDPTTGRAERTTRSLVEGVATTTTPAV